MFYYYLILSLICMIIYHIVQMRMERAARLLQQTDLTITQISERLGFDEVFYFSNVFKKQMKLSPMSYRKKCVRI